GQKVVPGIRPLVPNDWTVLTADAPPAAPDDAKVAVDLTGRKSGPADQRDHPPAWHGTILPKTDADAWLAAAFADFEEVVAMEKAMGKDAPELVELALYGARSRYRAATVRLGEDVPLSKTRAAVAKSDW